MIPLEDIPLPESVVETPEEEAPPPEVLGDGSGPDPIGRDPVSERAEFAIIGALLLHLDKESLRATLQQLPPLEMSDFSHPVARSLWSAAQACIERTGIVDPILLQDELKRRGETTPSMLFDIVQCAAYGIPCNAAEYARDILEASVVREATKRLGVAQGERHAEALEQQITEVMTEVLQRAHIATLTPQTKEEIIRRIYQRWENQRRGELFGLPTGLPVLDRFIGGLGNITVLAARPGMGKSSLARQIACFVARSRPVTYLGLEEDPDDVMFRAACSLAGESYDNCRRNPLPPLRMDEILQPFQEKLLIDFLKPRPATVEMAASAIRLAAYKGTKLVIVDHLGLLGGRHQREDDYAFTSRCMNALTVAAGDGACTLLVVHQLNRDCEKRSDKRPILSDLRDSGKVEQDAAVVLFVYREAYYNEDANDTIAEVIVAKNRNGATGSVEVGWDGPRMRFGVIPPPNAAPEDRRRWDGD